MKSLDSLAAVRRRSDYRAIHVDATRIELFDPKTVSRYGEDSQRQLLAAKMAIEDAHHSRALSVPLFAKADHPLNLPLRGKPFGTMRPAVARSPIHSASSSLRAHEGAAGADPARTGRRRCAKQLEVETPPSLYFCRRTPLPRRHLRKSATSGKTSILRFSPTTAT